MANDDTKYFMARRDPDSGLPCGCSDAECSVHPGVKDCTRPGAILLKTRKNGKETTFHACQECLDAHTVSKLSTADLVASVTPETLIAAYGDKAFPRCLGMVAEFVAQEDDDHATILMDVLNQLAAMGYNIRGRAGAAAGGWKN